MHVQNLDNRLWQLLNLLTYCFNPVFNIFNSCFAAVFLSREAFKLLYFLFHFVVQHVMWKLAQKDSQVVSVPEVII